MMTRAEASERLRRSFTSDPLALDSLLRWAERYEHALKVYGDRVNWVEGEFRAPQGGGVELRDAGEYARFALGDDIAGAPLVRGGDAG